MIRVIMLLLMCAPVFADYNYLRMGIGKNTDLTSSIPWEDQGEEGCMFGVGRVWQITKQDFVDVGYSHFSQCMAGAPINDDMESALDAFYLIYEQRWE